MTNLPHAMHAMPSMPVGPWAPRANRAPAGEGLARCGNEQDKMPLVHSRTLNLVGLRRSIPWCVAAIAVASAAGSAHASCPIALRGDPAIASQLQAELAQFPDDASPCVALAITCGAGDGGLTIELDDELGGHALRTFDSAGGASAFLISWSRRPGASSIASPGASSLVTPGAPSLSSPGLVARVLERPTATPIVATPTAWQGELHAAYIIVPGSHALGVGGALVRHHGIFQTGFAARVLTSPSEYTYDEQTNVTYIGGQLEGSVGLQGHMGFEGAPKWVGLRAELAAGASMITRLADTDLAVSSAGPHAAARLAAMWRLGHGVQLELGLGLEVEWQTTRNYKSPIGENELQPYPHLDVGLGWAP